VRTNPSAAFGAALLAATLAACSSDEPPAEPLRTVRTAELRYDGAAESNRYVGTVQARHEVEHAFRVGGKVIERRVEVGDVVRAGDILAVTGSAEAKTAAAAMLREPGYLPG